MVSLISLVTAALLLPFILAAPATDLEKRVDTTSYCGQWDSVDLGDYTLYLDQWGISGQSGSQCANVVSLSGSTVAWTTTWSWAAGTGGIKTYANIARTAGLGKQLSAISSMASTWKWSQTTTGTVVADVAYDLFTSSTSTGSGEYEIMIWLANINAGPISSTYGSDGKPTPIASNVSLASQTWNVYYGSNGVNYVYSFLPSSGSSITSFSGDINLFLKYLTSSGKISTSQYLITAEAGTEPTSGGATLTTSAYSLVIA